LEFQNSDLRTEHSLKQKGPCNPGGKQRPNLKQHQEKFQYSLSVYYADHASCNSTLVQAIHQNKQ